MKVSRVFSVRGACGHVGVCVCGCVGASTRSGKWEIGRKANWEKKSGVSKSAERWRKNRAGWQRGVVAAVRHAVHQTSVTKKKRASARADGPGT